QLLFWDSQQLGELRGNAARGSRIGERSAVESGSEGSREIPRDRIGGVDTDGDAVAWTGTGDLMEQPGLLFRLAHGLELGGALLHLGLGLGIVVRGLVGLLLAFARRVGRARGIGGGRLGGPRLGGARRCG